MAKKPPEQERLDEISADLPYELQSRMFEQMMTVSLGGAGLTITLASSLLQGQPLVLIAVVEFGLAAILALAGQSAMIKALFAKQNSRANMKLTTGLCSVLIGMGVGTLGASVFLL